MSKTTVIVTRDSLAQMLKSSDREYVARVVGRALVAIFNRQTAAEKQDNGAVVDNGIGFSGLDAKSGSLTAKSFLKNGTLIDWQLDMWLKTQKNGYPRICKYHKQLNEIALQKAQQNA